jgi:hypothetical protein
VSEQGKKRKIFRHAAGASFCRDDGSMRQPRTTKGGGHARGMLGSGRRPSIDALFFLLLRTGLGRDGARARHHSDPSM